MIEIQLRRSRETEPADPVYIVTDADIEAWRVSFPNINVEVELAEIAQYCKVNPTKRWTLAGVSKALHANLRGKNDRAVSRGAFADSKATKPDARVQQVGLSTDQYRHAIALDQLVTAKLSGLDDLTIAGTFRFNLDRLASAIVEGERKEFDAGNWTTERAYWSACYGTARVTLLRCW
jgi:hypothetical protein